jgi:hypothetical protein
MFGQAPSNQPPQQQEESGHGGSMLGKRHFMSGEAMARGAGQEDRHSGVHGAMQDEARVHEVVNKLKYVPLFLHSQAARSSACPFF